MSEDLVSPEMTHTDVAEVSTEVDLMTVSLQIMQVGSNFAGPLYLLDLRTGIPTTSTGLVRSYPPAGFAVVVGISRHVPSTSAFPSRRRNLA